jgi:hypothetical protein
MIRLKAVKIKTIEVPTVIACQKGILLGTKQAIKNGENKKNCSDTDGQPPYPGLVFSNKFLLSKRKIFISILTSVSNEEDHQVLNQR